MKIRHRYIIGLRLREADPNSLPKYPGCEDFCDLTDICYGSRFIWHGCSIPTAVRRTEKGGQIFQLIKIKWMMES
jgi:hypothetical protein